MGIVRDRMLRDMRLRGLSRNTQESYLTCARKFVWIELSKASAPLLVKLT